MIAEVKIMGRRVGGHNRTLLHVQEDCLSEKYINKHFLIRFYPDTQNKKHDDYLIRAKRMKELLGADLFTKTMQRTYRDQERLSLERFDHFFRRGWRITLKPV